MARGDDENDRRCFEIEVFGPGGLISAVDLESNRLCRVLHLPHLLERPAATSQEDVQHLKALGAAPPGGGKSSVGVRLHPDCGNGRVVRQGNHEVVEPLLIDLWSWEDAAVEAQVWRGQQEQLLSQGKPELPLLPTEVSNGVSPREGARRPVVLDGGPWSVGVLQRRRDRPCAVGRQTPRRNRNGSKGRDLNKLVESGLGWPRDADDVTDAEAGVAVHNEHRVAGGDRKLQHSRHSGCCGHGRRGDRGRGGCLRGHRLTRRCLRGDG
mmetsp:Transcript_20889/g.48902  ORF Transcript_20889/g.48902 Transcript_20889/m.48902 type:complete len:267 (-) Transcript_20889:600-1400(-)